VLLSFVPISIRHEQLVSKILWSTEHEFCICSTLALPRFLMPRFRSYSPPPVMTYVTTWNHLEWICCVLCRNSVLDLKAAEIHKPCGAILNIYMPFELCMLRHNIRESAVCHIKLCFVKRLMPDFYPIETTMYFMNCRKPHTSTEFAIRLLYPVPSTASNALDSTRSWLPRTFEFLLLLPRAVSTSKSGSLTWRGI
jgi:hypothetical protein